ncbi:hypothetical protein BDV96DRAFT_596599 [Lophiotrema nucula]|uniref:Uncharacterized protein n=1 Tax=Lophiotrema nucula TaxID=690887 RepID=A0A6A5ZHQ0_9PLEO|nr:hypothetical protein BDV96DRAFT_596599 [Lophiotrema nucula]
MDYRRRKAINKVKREGKLVADISPPLAAKTNSNSAYVHHDKLRETPASENVSLADSFLSARGCTDSLAISENAQRAISQEIESPKNPSKQTPAPSIHADTQQGSDLRSQSTGVSDDDDDDDFERIDGGGASEHNGVEKWWRIWK